MPVVAKFKVNSVESFEHGYVNVKMSPVCPPEDDTKVTSAENGSFWRATPNGKLEMTVNNPLAVERLQPGQSYYLTFERADG